ncbi:MAG: outer membrane protein assembly factor BamD [Candidatus Glassbacteria bacterium]|nr:outer membrane protein assembly factor BamD [Candidatus Glassbacteria bacterium]
MSRTISKTGAAMLAAATLYSLAFFACGPRKRFEPTPEGEFEAAYDFYQREKYPGAIERFKQIIYKYPGSDKVEEARYYLADSYFNNGEHQLAADEFERLNREFPQGRYAEVAMFKAALGYEEMSRRIERDQTETTKALETLELMLAKYPNTTYADTADVHIHKLKDRLAEKEFNTAMYYFKRKFYDSSIIYLKSVLETYPESKVVPVVLYQLYHASNKMGYPDDAADAKSWLCSKFPENEYARQLCTGIDSSATTNSRTSPQRAVEKRVENSP